jgi:hypothetical protein
VEARINLERRVEERTREIERRQKITESLRDIIGIINTKTPLEIFFDRAVQMAAHRLGAAGCILHKFDMDNQVVTQ